MKYITKSRRKIYDFERMKIFLPKYHKLHDPVKILDGWKLIPALEISSRIDSIHNVLKTENYELITSAEHNKRTLSAVNNVHSEKYVNFLSTVFNEWSKTEDSENGVIPYNFTSNKEHSEHLGLIHQVAQFSFDTCTPILNNTFQAAMNSVECALTAADQIMNGEKKVYSLCRPPGHHAGKDFYGGFCYLNNAAISAKYLIKSGFAKNITILDLDYHHGNGTQNIFYDTDKVQFISIHADPKYDYPYSWGTSAEKGFREGKGFNINYPLPLEADESTYLKVLNKALAEIKTFSPDILIISLGVDTHKDDPLGSFKLNDDSFSKIGQAFSKFTIPILVIQEGGYNLNAVGKSVNNFLKNL